MENIFVTATISGKLQEETYEQFLGSVNKSYVKYGDKFTLILDSWVRQNNPSLHGEKYDRTCWLKIIPPKCTPVYQPSDGYFCKQVKNYIGNFQNCPLFMAANCELSIGKIV